MIQEALDRITRITQPRREAAAGYAVARMAALLGRRPPLATGGRTPGSAPLIGRIVEGVVRDLGSELALPRDQVATALVALFDGFGIERLADPEAAPDELLAHAITAILRGSTDQPP